MTKESWLSERVVFGLLIIWGYFLVVVATMILPVVVSADKLPGVQAAMGNAKDALLVIGPLLGVIVNAIWKADKVDKQNADTVSTLASAVNTAMAMPAPDAPVPQSPGKPA